MSLGKKIMGLQLAIVVCNLILWGAGICLVVKGCQYVMDNGAKTIIERVYEGPQTNAQEEVVEEVFDITNTVVEPN